MRYKELIKYIRQNPNIVDDAYMFNMDEAQKILDAGNPMSFEQMIRCAMAKSSVPAYIWEKHVRALGRSKERAKRLRMRIATAAIAVVMAIILFFTAIPVGRAWARETINWIVSIFDNIMVVENDGTNICSLENCEIDELPWNEENIIILDSIDEFYNKTGLCPLVINSGEYETSEIWLRKIADGLRLSVRYKASDGKVLTFHQTWQSMDGFTVKSDGDYFERRILNGTYTMYCNMHDDSRRFEGWAMLEDRYIIIGFSDDEDTDKILESITFADIER